MEIRETNDGSATLYLSEMDEQYHSLNGAVTESKHVFIDSGYHYHSSPNPSVFEVGFGTGLNCLLTAVAAEKEKRQVFYMAIEKFPLQPEILTQLDYGRFVPGNGKELFAAIHECSWEVPVQLSPHFKLLKIHADFTGSDWQLTSQCDIVYFDAFGPDKQPGMWTSELIQRVFELTAPNGIFVTYSAKGEVRRRLMAAGFSINKLPGPPGKKEMLRGIKVV